MTYKKITIYYAIYINVFSHVTFYYVKVSTGDFLNTNNNQTEFPELRKGFEKHFWN